MEDRLEVLPRGWVREDQPRQFGSAQAAIGSEDGLAEALHHLGQGRLPGRDHLSGHVVGVHHRHSALTQNLGRGRLAHAHAAGQAEQLHVNCNFVVGA